LSGGTIFWGESWFLPGRVNSFDPNPSANLVGVDRGVWLVILYVNQAAEASLRLLTYI